MKSFVVRAAVALSIVCVLALSTPLWASAGSTGSGTATQSKAMRTYEREIVAYRESRQAIQLTFHAAVNSADATYQESLSVANNAARRIAALQAKSAAIFQAAAARSAALSALGSSPVKP
jgi:ribosomal protein S20